jgi:hypothetical protein
MSAMVGFCLVVVETSSREEDERLACGVRSYLARCEAAVYITPGAGC